MNSTLNMLHRDFNVFSSKFPSAMSFLGAANLRYECYLTCLLKERTETQDKNLDSFLSAPACREPWFVIMLRADCPHIEEILIRKGL